MLTVRVTRVRYYADDVADGQVPWAALGGAVVEREEYDSVDEAVRFLREDEGLTEFSHPHWTPAGWFMNPDGAVRTYGGGFDREVLTAEVSGRGAYAVWAHLSYSTTPRRGSAMPGLARIRELWSELDRPLEMAWAATEVALGVARELRSRHDPDLLQELVIDVTDKHLAVHDLVQAREVLYRLRRLQRAADGSEVC